MLLQYEQITITDSGPPLVEVVPARQAHAEDHLGDAEDDGDLHLEAVEHRDPATRQGQL